MGAVPRRRFEITCQESIQTANELGVASRDVEGAVTALRLRADTAAQRLPDYLIGKPVLPVNQRPQAPRVAFPAANRALAQLQETGVVKPINNQMRNCIFVAREVIDILSRPIRPGRYSPSPLRANQGHLRIVAIPIFHTPTP